MTKSAQWVCLGKVGRAHGLRGAFYIGGRREPLPPLSRLGVGGSKEPSKIFDILNQSANNGKALISLEGLVDRTAIEAFTGQTVWADKSELPVDEESEFFLDDLLGLQVKSTEGAVVGMVRRVYEHGASINLTIENAAGKKVDLPFVEAWFETDFDEELSILKLLVDTEAFADLWY